MTPAIAFPSVSNSSPPEASDRVSIGKNAGDWSDRAAALLAHEVAFIMHESFRSITDQQAIAATGELKVAIQASLESMARSKQGAGYNVHYQRMCSTPLLSPELEQDCFRQYNLLKYRANVHRAKLTLKRVDRDEVLLIEQFLASAAEIRNHIIQANCRLAMSIVKNYAESVTVFDELLSEATSTLMGAVEKFDFSRGYRFSTYATQSIHRRLYRILAQRQKQRNRFLNNSSDVLSQTLGADDANPEFQSEEMEEFLQRLLSRLELRERLIVEARFGLHTSGQKQTFLEIGKKLKISKERVRQLAERALVKLQSMAEGVSFELA